MIPAPRANDIKVLRATNRAAQRHAEAVDNVRDRLCYLSALVQMGKFDDAMLKDQANLIVTAVLALTASGAKS